ncbi:MAG: tRNA lysidine(34) synthetase TilS [Pseudomonadota bacterium]
MIGTAGLSNHAVSTGQAITAPEFDQLMALFAPFEDQPSVAIGLSGGPDSMALALLLKEWITARGGHLRALTVDHGLREDSGAEARWVAARMAEEGVDHDVLPWKGEKPNTAIQSAARQARHRLLTDFCSRHGILHLVMAHHLDDQAETLLLRVRQGSGPDGLAAMAPIRDLGSCRLLRPLLGVPKVRLLASLQAQGQSWVEDPSNRDQSFERVRLRQCLPALADQGMTAPGLSDLAAAMGKTRHVLDRAAAASLATTCRLHPAGFVTLDRARFLALSPFLARRALGFCLAAVRGRPYGPGPDAIESLFRHLSVHKPGFASQHGCLIGSYKDQILVFREPGRTERQRVIPGNALLWDHRFLVNLAEMGPQEPISIGPLTALGVDTVSHWTKTHEKSAPTGSLNGSLPPKIIWPALPAFWSKNQKSGDYRLISAPHLGYLEAGFPQGWLTSCRFLPERGPLTMAFTLV